MIETEKDLATLAAAVAKLLPGEWKAEQATWNARVVRADGAALVVRLDGPRAEWSGIYPPEYGHYQRKSITVSAARLPDAHVKEIQRRLLPEYLAAYAEACDRQARAEARHKRAVEVVLELAKLAPAGLEARPATDGSQPTLMAWGRTVGALDATFTVTPDDEPRVKITLDNVPPALAGEIARLIWKRGRR